MKWIQSVSLAGLFLLGASICAEAQDPCLSGPSKWSCTEGLNIAREGATATLLQDGRVVVIGGEIDLVGSFDSEAGAAEIYHPETGIWQISGPLQTNRRDHTATLLPSGKVLVAGGFDRDGEALRSAEIYDPASGTFSKPTGAFCSGRREMFSERGLHTATLLRSGMQSGRVLVVGGAGDGPVGTVEIYDPARGCFETAEEGLQLWRSGHSATLLPSGEVLIVGGFGESGVVDEMELYDPSMEESRSAGLWESPRGSHTATLMPGGLVLIAGGGEAGVVETYEFDDFVWQRETGPISSDVGDIHAATLLPSSDVLLVGRSRFEIYSADGLIDEGRLNFDLSQRTATLLPSGDVLTVGGVSEDTSPAEFLHASRYRQHEPDPLDGGPARQHHTATLLPNDNVVVVGGCGPDAFDTVDELVSTPDGIREWIPRDSLTEARCGHTATLLPSGKVLIAGGWRAGELLKSLELYDPDADAEKVIVIGELANGRHSHTATLLPSGKVMFIGGCSSGEGVLGTCGSPTTLVEVFDPVNRGREVWESGSGDDSACSTGRFLHSATLLDSGKVLVAGGATGILEKTKTAALYDEHGCSEAAEMKESRSAHDATLLPSGEVFVPGGAAEIYEPAADGETGEWVGILGTDSGFDSEASAILLPSGKVLVVSSNDGDGQMSVWEFDPGSRQLGPIYTGLESRTGFSATLLSSGEILLVGGDADSPLLELLPPDYPAARRPVITEVNGGRQGVMIQYGELLTITGHGFGTELEASGGQTRNSAVNYPLVQLQSLEGQQSHWLIPGARSNFSEDLIEISDLSPDPAAPTLLNPGWHALRVFTAGIPSEAINVQVACSVVIESQPASASLALPSCSGPATFAVEARGARSYQWQILTDGGYRDIAGATRPELTLNDLTCVDVGASYRVIVDSGCTDEKGLPVVEVSKPVSLTIDERVEPEASLITPNGGEFWRLSEPDVPSTETIEWTMSDNFRICGVSLSLLYSSDGQTYDPVPGRAGAIKSFGAGAGCRDPVPTLRHDYKIPQVAPMGEQALYKVRLTVTDFVGNSQSVESLHGFRMASVDRSRETLILWHKNSMLSFFGPQPVHHLENQLDLLAEHPKVQGLVFDLGAVTGPLSEHFQSWHRLSSNQDGVMAAYNLLFAGGGLHDLLYGTTSEDRGLLDIFPGIRHILLIGDDRIIPMARIRDGATLLPESTYVHNDNTEDVDDPMNENEARLTADVAVGRSLQSKFFLSDDPIAVNSPITQNELNDGPLLPDFSIGRLVETPEEISRSINIFLRMNGALDLSSPAELRKVLITGYDFLVDSTLRVSQLWAGALGQPGTPDLDSWPVAMLLPGVLDEKELKSKIDQTYKIMSFNGHATHYQLGVTGDSRYDIQGLSSRAIYNPHCGSLTCEQKLAGSVVYAVGCHAGLPVPPSSDPRINSLDLPQAILGAGAMAFVANSGYGWGLQHGIGYSERLMETLTEELLAGGTQVFGEAVRRAKLRYFLETPGFDSYDRKSVMQWTFYGFPMFEVVTGIPPAEVLKSVSTRILDDPPRALGKEPVTEKLGPVVVEKRLSDGPAEVGDVKSSPAGPLTLPPNLTRLALQLDLSAPGVYVKRRASGEIISEDDGERGEGCPAPEPGEPAGCYYTLNGLVERSTSTADLPLQPYLILDSRISGTSQHGVLWLGGTYREEQNWTPVFGALVSNTEKSLADDLGGTPFPSVRKVSIRRPTGQDVGDACRPADIEISSLVIPTGEALWDPVEMGFTTQRTYEAVDLEAFYFNDTTGEGQERPNCDRLGPDIPEGVTFHEVSGSTVSWSIDLSSQEVWRVVVVYNTGEMENGRGRWIPLELTNGGTGMFTGLVGVAGLEALTYVVQAVDFKGNVSWLNFRSGVPRSGVMPDLPETVDVNLDPLTGGGGSRCDAGPETLCLHSGRFEVKIDWKAMDGLMGTGKVFPIFTRDSGLFWFFNLENWELMVKVLDGCGINGYYWVYGAASTDVQYSLRVTDTQTRDLKVYRNEPGSPAVAITDFNAFATCSPNGQ